MKNKTRKSHIFLSSRRDRKDLERRRMKAARLFKKGKTQADVARLCMVSREATRQWHLRWSVEGVEGLRAKGNPGPKPRLSEAQKKKVEKALLTGPRAFGYATNVWTLKRISECIRTVAAVSYHQGHVWKVLCKMGWSSQKPETRVKERDERAIRYWKEVTWPAIKKKRNKGVFV